MLVALEVNRGAIFRDVGHALHTAFLVLANDARQGCVTRSMLLQMMTAGQRKLTASQAEWFGELRGSSAGTIDFSGLRDDEIRAQCALVVSAVRSRLSSIECQAVIARFGATEFEDVDGKRRFAFSAERSQAIRLLAAWLVPVMSELPPLALDCIVAREYADHGRTKISLRELAANFGLSKDTFGRRGKEVRAYLRKLEREAHEKLRPYFVKQGVIPAPVESD